MNKELDLYLILEKDFDNCESKKPDKIVIGRFHNSDYAKNIIKILRKVALDDKRNIFRVYIYNKEAEEKDIIEHGLQICYMDSGEECFEFTISYCIEYGLNR